MGRAERVTTREASADHRTVVPRLCPLRISSRAGWMPIQDNTVQTLEAANLQSSPALFASDQTLSRVQAGGGVVGLLAVAGRITCKDARLCRSFVGAWSPTCDVRHTASHGAGTWPWNTQALSCGRHQTGEEGGHDGRTLPKDD